MPHSAHLLGSGLAALKAHCLAVAVLDSIHAGHWGTCLLLQLACESRIAVISRCALP